ncbi:Uncharacterised protein [uncultured Clostridium sp.]|uniref:hypothetical protein n=1 Tax=uncultured Clostridium sp. TaxID=59620 RepID=UPI00082114DF|nr:hypothetical protein [uncultured Clostridium sp.]SCJ96891.1 Uncharacterised protein [uncultured Clostridium sp.]
MFNGVIIVIGIIEFLIGASISIFAKSERVCGFIQFLYDFEKGKIESLPILNKWIGQNYGLVGSLYIFFASIAVAFNVDWFMLLLSISLIEVLSYKRINKGIKEILKNSQ